MIKLPNACDYRGASMGRQSNIATPRSPVKFKMERVRLNSGGYDNGGAYWGWGDPLYFAYAEGNSMFVRGASREAAKRQVRLSFPLATFYK